MNNQMKNSNKENKTAKFQNFQTVKLNKNAQQTVKGGGRSIIIEDLAIG